MLKLFIKIGVFLFFSENYFILVNKVRFIPCDMIKLNKIIWGNG